MDQEKTATEIIRRLCQQGWEAYLAGGAARDILNGEKPDDYDVVTRAPYEKVKELFKDRKLSLVGASFKVCIVDGVEVSTYRKDTYFGQSAKNCQIREASTIQEDLARRDITINSMAFCPYNGDIIDEYGGIDDLKNRVIKFTGNPVDRILEDPCRILRACRFLAKIEGRFDPPTFIALKNNVLLVEKEVAPERIRLEIVKALQYKRPGLFFDAMHDIGILGFVFPGLEACYGHDGGMYHDETIDLHSKIVGDSLSPRKPMLRLAGYLHDIGKPATAKIKDNKLSFINHAGIGEEMVKEAMGKLKFSLKEISYVRALTRHHMRYIEYLGKPKAVRKMLKAFSEDNVDWKDWLCLRIADTKGNLKKKDLDPKEIKTIVLKIRQELKPSLRKAALTINDLKVSGRDIMKALDLEAGPQIGRILDSLLECVLEQPELNTKDALLNIALEGKDRR